MRGRLTGNGKTQQGGGPRRRNHSHASQNPEHRYEGTPGHHLMPGFTGNEGHARILKVDVCRSLIRGWLMSFKVHKKSVASYVGGTGLSGVP